jgi:hypothetical protein
MEHYYTFQLGELAHLSDPCYSTQEDGNYSKFNQPCHPGLWDAKVALDDGCVVSVEYCHTNTLLLHKAEMQNFQVAVDSGQFGIFDASIWEDESDFEASGSFYRECCDATLSGFMVSPIYKHEYGKLSEFGFGFVSRTGYGDGSYNVEAYYNNGKLVKAKITFIEQDENDDDDYDESDYDWEEALSFSDN